MLFRTYVLWPQTQRVKQSAQIRKQNAGHIFQLLNYFYQGFIHDYLAEFLIQSTLDEPEEPQPQPESKERTMTVSILTEMAWTQ